MLIDERRQHILGLLQSDRRVLVAELSSQLGISQITIRKDLDHLEAKRLIQRTHGGALPVQTGALIDPSLQGKQKQHSHEKQRIAAAAA
jgi:DeoR family transcriptional regulator of aga operon